MNALFLEVRQGYAQNWRASDGSDLSQWWVISVGYAHRIGFPADGLIDFISLQVVDKW